MSSNIPYTSSTLDVGDVQREGANLHWPDYVVIVSYFVGILTVGFWSSKKSKKDSVSGYFMADKSMNWILVGASLFGSNIGSGHFIGLAGSGAITGITISAFEFQCMFMLMILGWIFVPVYAASGINTMPEYINKRFGGQRIRVYLSLLALMMYIFTKISADLYAGAIFIKQSLDLNLYVSVGVLLILAAIFTIGGGLTAVMWTDLVQVILMLLGALVLTLLSLDRVGGYTYLMENFEKLAEPTDKDYIAYKDNCDPNNSNTTCESCSAVTKYYNSILHPPSDDELPWPGVVFGLLANGLWYWCSDQVIVQRALSAKNVTHAKAGCIFASLIKLLPLYILVVPGMAARALWPNEIGCSDPKKCLEICGSEAGCTNIAYPLLVLRIMPAGATGLMLSVMLAALMSSLTSIFNSASTIFSIDIYCRFRKNAGEIEQVIVGRFFVLVLVVISIIWIPVIEAAQGSQLFHYIQSLTSYFGPPVGAVYLLALFWSRINEKGAFWGLIIGFVIGVIRFVMDFSYTHPTCASGEPDLRPLLLSKVHYLHFSIILFFITCIVTITISLLTDPIDEIYLHRLTFGTKFSEKVRLDIDTEEVEKVKDISKSTLNLEEGDNKVKFLYTICCMSSKSSVNDSNIDTAIDEDKVENTSNREEEEAIRCANHAKEDPFWRIITNSGGILIIVIVSFIYGYYA